MVKIEGINAIRRTLERLLRKSQAESNVSVQVGYTQRYAIHVHENLQARHPVGQAKYLEQPARELSSELGSIICQAVKGGASVKRGLLLAGLQLQRASQELVPVDTGALKGSAFTAEESEADAIATAAFQQSEARRTTMQTRRGAAVVKKKAALVKRRAKNASKKKASKAKR